jgi:hypothetical protein
MNFHQINVTNSTSFSVFINLFKNNLKIFLGCLFLSLLACKNEPQTTNSVANKPIEANVLQKAKPISASSDKIEAFLKSGKTGIFEDTCFTAIMDVNHTVFITADTSNYDGSGYQIFNYTIKSYTKNGDNWQIKEEKQVSDSTNYKSDLPEIKLEDMNKDGEKDIMLLMAVDGRGNQQYTLFLRKNKGQTLVKVEGFEELYAPTYDAKRKVIVSTNSYHRGQTIDVYKIVSDSLQHLESKEEDFGKHKNDDEDK